MDVTRITLSITLICTLFLSLYSIYLTKCIDRLEQKVVDLGLEVGMGKSLTEQQERILVDGINNANKVGTWRK